MTLGLVVAAAPLAYAECVDSDGQVVQTSVIDCPTGTRGQAIIWQLLEMAVNFLAAGVGIAVVAGIVFGAITYAAHRNPECRRGLKPPLSSSDLAM